MKRFVWFVLGIAGGFVLAHLVDKDPRGHELMGQVDARIGEFTDRIGDAYREQEAQLTNLVAEAKDAAADAVVAVKDAAVTTVATVRDAGAGTVEPASDAASDDPDTARDAATKLTD